MIKKLLFGLGIGYLVRKFTGSSSRRGSAYNRRGW